VILKRSSGWRLPFTIGTVQHAPYPEVANASGKKKVLPFDFKLR
jgi:hypothetical protein